MQTVIKETSWGYLFCEQWMLADRMKNNRTCRLPFSDNDRVHFKCQHDLSMGPVIWLILVGYRPFNAVTTTWPRLSDLSALVRLWVGSTIDQRAWPIAWRWDGKVMIWTVWCLHVFVSFSSVSQFADIQVKLVWNRVKEFGLRGGGVATVRLVSVYERFESAGTRLPLIRISK